MTCTMYKPVLIGEISKMEQLRRIAYSFDEDAFTLIKIKELKLLLEAPAIIEILASRTRDDGSYLAAENYLSKLV